MQLIVIPTSRVPVDAKGQVCAGPQATGERLTFRLVLEHELPIMCGRGQSDAVAAAAQVDPALWRAVLDSAQKSDNVPNVDRLIMAAACEILAIKGAIQPATTMPKCGQQAGQASPGPKLVKP